MTTASFNGVELADAVPEALVVAVKRSLVGARRTVFEDVPGVAGSWIFGDRPGDRKTVLSIHVLADDYETRRDAVRRLATWADSEQAAALVIDDEADRYETAILATAPDPEEWLNYATVDLEFRTGPYALAASTSSTTWTATSGAAHTVTVPDDVEVYPIFTLTAGGAGVSSLSLDVNGKTLTYGTSIAASGKITVSSLAFMVTTGANADTACVGTFVPAAASMSAVDGSFPVLESGANSVTVTTSNASSMTVEALWRRRYR